jgi:hypothetical protein
MRAFPVYGSITQQWSRGWITHHSLQLSLNRRFRNGVSFGFNDTIVLSSTGSTAARLQHSPDGSYLLRSDQAEADRLFGRTIDRRHLLKAHFVWDLPDLQSTQSGWRAVGWLVNDWQLSGIWTGMTGNPYTVGFSYQNGGSSVNLTGSQDYGARIRIVGDQGSGCTGDPYRQFNTSAFQGPLSGTVGLESGNDYLRSCFSSVLDLSVARNIRVGGGRQIQLRVDMFNAQQRDHRRPEQHDQPLEPQRSGDGDESAIRREWQPDRVSVAAAGRGIWRGQRVSGTSKHPGASAILVLAPSFQLPASSYQLPATSFQLPASSFQVGTQDWKLAAGNW